ncbi:helix-hairpin-helix domain-containing protein [Euzebya sp.]|uniref:helix-hairpin-helix domain-containing protein n=1 Tax=Euzebya sp. TaxID=1971409 RepID=UPI00351314B9
MATGDRGLTGNADVARLLYELGALTGRSRQRGDRYRAEAYRRAAAAVAAAPVEVLALSERDLTAIPGVGAGTAARIAELRRTGTIAALERLRAADPAGVEGLLAVPGIGPVTAARLRDALGVRDIDGLRVALAAGRLEAVRGLGPVTRARIAEGLEHLGPDDGPVRLPILDAVGVATRFEATLRALDGVSGLAWCGDLGRMRDTVGRVELLLAAPDPAAVLARAATAPPVREVAGRSAGGVELATFDGPVVHVAAVPPAAFAVERIRRTAHPSHWRSLVRVAAERGIEVDSDGLRDATGTLVEVADDAAVYAAIGLQPVPAEQRDGTDELALAAEGRLPCCAEVADLRGDLHDHSDWSGDGRMTLAELLDGAVARGWGYVGVTDHAEDLTINGLSRAEVLAQRDELAALAAERPQLAVLHGAELNIGADGSVDYDPDFLAGYGWAVASVHSHFRMDAATQTRRLTTAIQNPAVRAIGHLTGRRVGRRQGIELDVDAVLDACLETGTALEVNCHLDRFDAPAEVLAEAAARGVLVVISTDAHGVRELDNHRWGVALARRGRVPAELVTNTWPAERFLDWAAR